MSYPSALIALGRVWPSQRLRESGSSAVIRVPRSASECTVKRPFMRWIRSFMPEIPSPAAATSDGTAKPIPVSSTWSRMPPAVPSRTTETRPALACLAALRRLSCITLNRQDAASRLRASGRFRPATMQVVPCLIRSHRDLVPVPAVVYCLQLNGLLAFDFQDLPVASNPRHGLSDRE